MVVSTGGGTEPVWARDGTELFYRNGSQMLVAEVETGRTFSARPPVVLFEGTYETDRSGQSAVPTYDVSPDGHRFVMVRRTDAGEVEPPQMNFVLNWFEELRRLAPADN